MRVLYLNDIFWNDTLRRLAVYTTTTDDTHKSRSEHHFFFLCPAVFKPHTLRLESHHGRWQEKGAFKGWSGEGFYQNSNSKWELWRLKWKRVANKYSNEKFEGWSGDFIFFLGGVNPKPLYMNILYKIDIPTYISYTYIFII